MLYIGIDSGTQSTKSIVLDLASGKIAASAQSSYELIPGLPPGHMEQDPKVWIDAVDQTIDSCLKQLGDQKDAVRAIGVSGQQHGLVVLNDSSKVVRPAKLWCDVSTAKQCQEIIEEFGGEPALIKLLGNTMLPGWTAPKILWLKQNEPENYESVSSILLPHDSINFWLTGEKRMEYGDASSTGLLDVRTRRWCEPVIEFIDPALEEKLPSLGSSRQAVGLLRDTLRQKWGLKSSPIISAGGGDNMMGAIGTGNVLSGVVTVSLGTSGTVYAYSTEPVVDSEGEVAAFCDSTDKWLPLVCTMNVTVATEQLRKLFGWDIDGLNEAVGSAPAGASGVTFLPYLTGGRSKSKVWRQICADTFRVPVVCLATAEGAALGAALHGAWVDSLVNNKSVSLPDLTNRVVKLDESSRANPDRSNAQLYQDKYSRFKGLTQRLATGGFL